MLSRLSNYLGSEFSIFLVYNNVVQGFKSLCYKLLFCNNKFEIAIDTTCYWGEPERAPHYRGLRDHVHRPTDRPINRDRPTVSVPFT